MNQARTQPRRLLEPPIALPQLRPDTKHKLHFVGKREGLFEQNVGVPFSNASTEHRASANLDFQPILDRLKLDARVRAA
jgi:hypothetical protein